MHRLVLFDIDGTLLHSHGAGRRAMEAALIGAFGTKGSPAYRYDGKTDRQIVRDLMRGEGFGDAVIDARMAEVLDTYVAGLQREIASPDTRVEALTGVMQLLDALVHRSHCVVGLLTGNLEPGAQHKLTGHRPATGAGAARAFGRRQCHHHRGRHAKRHPVRATHRRSGNRGRHGALQRRIPVRIPTGRGLQRSGRYRGRAAGNRCVRRSSRPWCLTRRPASVASSTPAR
jgi:hypothetical protein